MENLENNEALVVKNEGIFEMNQNSFFLSKKTETEDEKIELFNALESCDVLLNNCVGQEILIKDVYCEKRTGVDEKTGEVKDKFRTILFDVNGQTYATGSYGIYNVIKKIISVFGAPTWENGIKVEVAKRPIKDGKFSLTLLIKK